MPHNFWEYCMGKIKIYFPGKLKVEDKITFITFGSVKQVNYSLLWLLINSY